MDGRTYVFSGDYFWVLSVYLTVEGGPIKITSKWMELKTPIDCAYLNPDGRIVFVKGIEYWKYYGYVLEEGPRDISQLGLPPDLEKPDAAFVWGGNDKTYYFKGKNYWRYNEYNKKVDPNYPRSIEVWGLPLDMKINSAMTWKGNQRTYFFQDTYYWKLCNDRVGLGLCEGYPRIISKPWMKCDAVP